MHNKDLNMKMKNISKLENLNIKRDRDIIHIPLKELNKIDGIKNSDLEILAELQEPIEKNCIIPYLLGKYQKEKRKENS